MIGWHGSPLLESCVLTPLFSVSYDACRKRLDCWEIVHLTAYNKKKNFVVLLTSRYFY